jgi:hypothetical protein
MSLNSLQAQTSALLFFCAVLFKRGNRSMLKTDFQFPTGPSGEQYMLWRLVSTTVPLVLRSAPHLLVSYGEIFLKRKKSQLSVSILLVSICLLSLSLWRWDVRPLFSRTTLRGAINLSIHDNTWLNCGQEGVMLLVKPSRRNFEIAGASGADET